MGRGPGPYRAGPHPTQPYGRGPHGPSTQPPPQETWHRGGSETRPGPGPAPGRGSYYDPQGPPPPQYGQRSASGSFLDESERTRGSYGPPHGGPMGHGPGQYAPPPPPHYVGFAPPPPAGHPHPTPHGALGMPHRGGPLDRGQGPAPQPHGFGSGDVVGPMHGSAPRSGVSGVASGTPFGEGERPRLLLRPPGAPATVVGQGPVAGTALVTAPAGKHAWISGMHMLPGVWHALG